MTEFDAILASARAGDEAGFRGLYDVAAQRIAGFAAARGAEDPEAIVNETFLRAFRRLDSFAGDERAFLGWVFAIARNVLIDEHRRAKRRPLRSSDSDVPEQSTPDASHAAFVRLGNERVARLLGQLTVDQREVLALRMVADLSLDEVARIVDKPVTAVKRLQARGLRRLEKVIREEGSPDA